MEQKLPFDMHVLKTELLLVVVGNKPPKLFVANHLVEKYGHRVLRLPPYHYMFNPIEHLWGITKSYYNKHIGRDEKLVENCLNMWQEALAQVTTEMCDNTIQHTEGLVQQCCDREVRFDNGDIAPIIICTCFVHNQQRNK